MLLTAEQAMRSVLRLVSPAPASPPAPVRTPPYFWLGAEAEAQERA